MWEYKMVKTKIYLLDFKKDDEKFVATLNDLGKENWELVTTFTASDSGVFGTGGGTLSATLLFKRALN
jgi:hypothetical protein